MVKVGDTVKATGMGEFFVSLTGCDLEGKVIHTSDMGLDIKHTKVQDGYAKGNIGKEHLTEGVLYEDSSGEILWLASDDYDIIQRGE